DGDPCTTDDICMNGRCIGGGPLPGCGTGGNGMGGSGGFGGTGGGEMGGNGGLGSQGGSGGNNGGPAGNSGAAGMVGCPSNCDDGNPCTIDTCGASTGFQCVHVPESGFTFCDDGDPC